tara:strand:+ start:224 stop:2038 length:1815 start_codon:yes stop_codon:yes gene_type:complete
MINLCINSFHDASITLMEDGKVIAHLLEERHKNMKHATDPLLALTKIRDYVDRIDLVSFSHLFPEHYSPQIYLTYLKHLSGIKVPTQCPQFMDVRGHLQHPCHHDLHAICAFRNSGFEDATIVVIDGAGTNHWYGKENQTIYEVLDNTRVIEKTVCGRGVCEIDDKPVLAPNDNGLRIYNPSEEELPEFLNDIANIGAGFSYSAVTEWLGWHGLDCGKTMGLSTYGKENSNIPCLLDPIHGGNHNFQSSIYGTRGMMGANILGLSEELKSNQEFRQDLAYRIQKDYEDYLIATCERALSKSRSKNLVLTGGCALNCVANYKLLKSLPEDINLYVEPVSDDSGVSMGGAMQVCDMNIDCKLDNLYLGTQLEYDYELLDHEIESNITVGEVAKLLVDGNIVAIAQGRSEIGPRALGNRSILFDPRVKNGKDIVNKVKNREWFRPFAGTILLEHAKEWFDLDRLEESPYMMYAVDTLPEKIDLIPAIVHVDGTCRIQTVTREHNKNYYDLISEFYRLTGVPILFNTSFNLAGDTMVEYMDDALYTIRQSDIPYMYLPEIGKIINSPKNLTKDGVNAPKYLHQQPGFEYTERDGIIGQGEFSMLRSDY